MDTRQGARRGLGARPMADLATSGGGLAAAFRWWHLGLADDRWTRVEWGVESGERGAREKRN